MSVFISPHDDDHALFGAFTCLREHPVLVVVFDGHVQQQRGLPVTCQERAAETEAAARILGCSRVVRLGFSDAGPLPRPADILQAIHDKVPAIHRGCWFLPAEEEDGHDQHNLVAQITPVLKNCTPYLTYTRNGGKSTSDKPVQIEHGDWIASKLLALACYKSQMNMDPRMGCAEHFLRSQEEYYL